MEPKHYTVYSRKEIGRYLRYYRQKAGFTAKQVAERLGYASHQSIFNIESGKTPINSKKMYDFLDMCGVDPEHAFTEPYSEVSDPSRQKRPGSMRLQEMIETFHDLSEDNQRTLLKVARALRDQQTLTSGGGARSEGEPRQAEIAQSEAQAV